MTNQNDSLMIFSTVSKILIEIIEQCSLASLPIHIKGIRRSKKEVEGEETARDRIYKQIIKKNVPAFRNYKFQDLGEKGIALIPEGF